MHKNHELIVDACKILKEQGISDYKVIFTLDRKTALYSERIARIIEEENLPIEYTGIIPKEEVFDYYVVACFICCWRTCCDGCRIF